ncbi:MAG: UbiD family decarboxylase [Thermoprotei archaeon]
MIEPKGFRSFVEEIEREGGVKRVKRRVSWRYEAAGVLAAFDPQPTILENVDGHTVPVMGNIYSTRTLFAKYFGVPQGMLTAHLLTALSNPVAVGEVERWDAPCQQVVEDTVDLPRQLPALLHTQGDGGRYVTAATFCVRDPEYGYNLSVHRLMMLEGETGKMGMRVVPRDLYTYLKRGKGELEAVATIGNGLGYLVAAATTVPIGYDELGLANALERQRLVRALSVDLPVPADSEFVLEGRIVEATQVKEGPFFDLTLTLDAVREQPVFEVKKLTHRVNPYYHEVLPGLSEHRSLMGLPREVTIYSEVSKVAECVDVRLTPGGGCWLHAVVKIRKKGREDGLKAIEAAFKGHSSLKHVVVVDEDIDIDDTSQVEWAIATRFQANRGLVVINDAVGSSLDPSADRITRKTSKMGLDATIPHDKPKDTFRRWSYQVVKRDDYL